MKRKYLVILILGLILIGIAVWQIAASQRGLTVTYFRDSNPPITIITPAQGEPDTRPTVLIAHGFAGSSVLMRGFALTLAHAGYTTISWDFDGHGENTNPLKLSNESSGLLMDAEAALAEATAAGLANPDQVAILGHSMGSGVALTYGTTYPDTFATIAISPVSQTVTASLPHNLLLMAGSREPQFVANAEKLLKMAGGENSSFSTGAARKLVVIPNVEHISILFSPSAHAAARSCLDATFGAQPGATNYVDRRILWFGLGILGFIMVSNAVVNMISVPAQEKVFFKPLWLRLLALLGGSIIGTIILWLASLGGVQIAQLLGLLVGGFIIIWFGVAGVISLLILRPRLYWPKSNEIIKGLVVFAGLWLGVGLLGNYVWLPWLLIPHRLVLWVPASILLLPWFFAVGEVSKTARPGRQIGWWLYQVIVVLAGFYLAITLYPGLGFIFIILPLIPVILGLHMLAISSKHGNWAFALSGALFTAWLMLAVFPLQ
jgi:pimeloyl-ACP methyl ester carboxylesterase